jgi:hypothetical protein
MPEDQPLAELIAQAVEKAIRPLQDRIASLETKSAKLKEEMAALSTIQSHLSENQLIQLHLINDIKQSAIQPTQKVSGHFEEIVKALSAREQQCESTGQKWDYMAFWVVEELLGLSHRRVSQLADIARNDPRFAIGWHPRKKNMKVFRLNHFTFGDMAFQLHKKLGGKN